MKSTGEVMGTAGSFAKAYDKAQDAVGKPIPESGTAWIDLSAGEFPDPDTDAGATLLDGYADHFDLVDFDATEDLNAALREGRIDLVVSRDRDPLETCVEEEITYFSTTASAAAALEAIGSKDEPIDVEAISDRPRRTERWGALGDG
jgi:carbamoyl-phosphate synthase large subunit